MADQKPDFTAEHFLFPRPCKCGKYCFRASHPDVVDFYRDFESEPGEAEKMMALLDEEMTNEYVPSTDVPGRPLKYTTPAEKRAANREYQRRWREKTRKDKDLTSLQKTRLLED